jgi:predicted nucleic acid-binding protein
MIPVLLDTNVLSEMVRPKPEPKVLAFLLAQDSPFISALTLHELMFGAERAHDGARRAKLNLWISGIQSQFAERIVDIDGEIASVAGRLRAAAANAGHAVDAMDSLIAACAVSRDATIATRNLRDFAPLGIQLINPWD